jgi:hypothetical protein
LPAKLSTWREATKMQKNLMAMTKHSGAQGIEREESWAVKMANNL